MKKLIFKNVQPCSFHCVLSVLRDSANEVRLTPAPDFIPTVEWEITAIFDDVHDAHDTQKHIDMMLKLTQ